jgi:hypothetical protein
VKAGPTSSIRRGSKPSDSGVVRFLAPLRVTIGSDRAFNKMWCPPRTPWIACRNADVSRVLGRLPAALPWVMMLVSLVSGGCWPAPQGAGLANNVQSVPMTALATSQPLVETEVPGNAEFVESVDAVCRVPDGWVAEPLKQGSNHKHQIWISPSGHTAYGVLFVSLPLPAALVPIKYRTQRVLDGFLGEMKKREGRADLIERSDDPGTGASRFVAEGGQYRVHANLTVRGLRAWFVYAGTRQNQLLLPDELSIAERARDQTKVGMSR